MQSQKKNIVEPYSRLACIYDDVMLHVDYKRWSKYVLKIIKKWHPNTKTILDVSCGTGNFLLSLKSKKYRLIGFDLCFEMVKIARDKLDSHSKSINFFQGEMTSFHLRKKVDVVTCLYDSINYLLDLQSWKLMFDNTYDLLNADGLFVFDICTEKNSVKYFYNYSERGGGYSYEYIRKSSYDREKKIHSNKFVISDDNDGHSYTEIHRQRIFLIKEVLSLIASTNFKVMGVFDEFYFKRATEESLRVHFVLKK